MALKYKANARQGTTVMKAAKKQSAMKKHTDMKKQSAVGHEERGTLLKAMVKGGIAVKAKRSMRPKATDNLTTMAGRQRASQILGMKFRKAKGVMEVFENHMLREIKKHSKRPERLSAPEYVKEFQRACTTVLKEFAKAGAVFPKASKTGHPFSASRSWCSAFLKKSGYVAKRLLPMKLKSYLGYIVYYDDLDFDKQASINLHNNGTNVLSVPHPLKPRHVYRVKIQWNPDLEDEWVDGYVVKATYVGPRKEFTGQQKYNEMLGVEDLD